MNDSIITLSLGAAIVGFMHTIIGPDHYLPFLVIGKARNWRLRKTMLITFISGLGHVMSSMLVGAFAILFGIALKDVAWFEDLRGAFIPYLLIGLGAAYILYGYWRKKHKHTHKHLHMNGTYHEHRYEHVNAHSHNHSSNQAVNITPWVLFVIFLLGPCEALWIFLVDYGLANNLSGFFIVSGVFCIVTVLTMLSVVYLTSKGFQFISLQRFEKHMNTIAGITIMLCGVGILTGL